MLFNIHDYTERLTPSKGNRFFCPNCNSPKFTIKKGDSRGTCWGGGCSNEEIQNAILPPSELQQLLAADREEKRKRPIAYTLFAAHIKEMALSAVPEDLARRNIRSVECNHQIAEFLDWKGYMGSIGWLYTGVDPETGLDTGIGQFKPDEKFAFPNGNLAKYLSQKHAYDATCFRVPMWVMRKVSNRYAVPMPDGMAIVSDSDDVTPIFWPWVIDNPQLPISPAEGGKKALLLLAEGRIGISISGVDMATIGRGADLVPTLKKLAVKGRPVEPFYDADIIEKPDVENALMAFGAALTRAGCVITVPTWDLGLGKGVDDLAVNQGEAWENCLTVLSYKDWLKKLEQRRQEFKKRSPVKKAKKQAQPQEAGGVDVPANLKVLQIEPTEYPAGQQFDGILQILGKTEVNEPVAPILFGTEEDAEFARQYSIGSIALPTDEEGIQQIIGQLQSAGCRAVSYFADGNGETEPLLLTTCERRKVACVVINSESLYPDIEKGDIRQILTTMSTDDFVRRIEEELHSRAEQDKEHRQSLAIGYDSDGSEKNKGAVASLKRSFDQESGGNNSPAKSKTKQLLNLIETQWGERLRFNEMTQQVEMDGETCKLDRVHIRVARELDTDIDKEKASDLVIETAERNTYSPVRDYLTSVADVEPINLENLALRYFGTDNPLHATLLKRTLIAAVARVFEPGCKVDTLCILQGDQGDFKSTFWQILAGEAWFTDNLSEANEKDEKLKLRRYWILEFSEFETAYRRKEVEQLKAFLSSRIDSLRRPYGRTIEDFPRTSIFVGSTNGQEFLHDPTGERRYWVIPVKQKIPIQMLDEERDRIWAAVVQLYRAGEQWWLTPDEDALLTQANQGWQSSDAWEADILSYLDTKSEATISELLNKPLAIELQHQGKAEQMRVGNILRRNGWKKAPAQKRIDGKPQWYWEKVVTGGDEVVTEVVTPLNPVSATISEQVSLPVTTFSANFSPNTNDVVDADETNNSQDETNDSQSGESLENRGSDTHPQTSESFSEQRLEGVTTSASPPQFTYNPIAPPEPETAPTEPESSEIEPEMGVGDEIFEAIKEAIATLDRAAAREAWQKIKNSPTQKEAVKAKLTEEEVLNFKILVATGWLKGMRVKYVGTKFESLAGVELTIDKIDRNGITCTKPDGSYITDLDKEDLVKLEQSEGGA
jgi:predicted P-loop ATPase